MGMKEAGFVKNFGALFSLEWGVWKCYFYYSFMIASVYLFICLFVICWWFTVSLD